MTAAISIAPLGVRLMIDTHHAASSPHRRWTREEQETLRRLYPDGGLEACIKALPGRTPAAIYSQTDRIGVRLKGGSVGNVARLRALPATAAMDDMIRRVYQTKPDRGSVKACARALCRSVLWVNRRATRLGLVAPRFKDGPWSEKEMDLLRAHGVKTPQTISRILKQHGFKRSPSAVVMKMKRTRLDRSDDGHMNVDDVADCMGVHRSAVDGWISKGLIRTVQTGGPGGRHRTLIHRSRLRRFIMDNLALIDIRKVDKDWFVDLIANGASS